MRTRQHVNPLGLSFEEFRGEMPRLRPGAPVEIELGCADAQFLFERAAADPARIYLGFEIRDKLVDLVNEKARDLGAPVQAIFASANHHLGRVVPHGRADRVYVNFPDPWFKNRQKKRRMVDGALARGIAEVLRPGGDLFFQTDVWDVGLDAMEVFERRDHWFENVSGPWTFWKDGNPYGVRSWREENAEAEGMKVWRIFYRRRIQTGQ